LFSRSLSYHNKKEKENTLNLAGETMNSLLLLYFQNDKDRVEAIRKFAQCLKDNKSLFDSFKEATKTK